MFSFLADLPSDVLAVEASGPLTHEDYQRLNAKMEALASDKKIKALYVVDNDVSEYSPHAFWDDQVFGIRHWRDFSHLALVTDLPWARAAARLFAPVFPAKLKVFRKAELADAKAWISAPTEVESSPTPALSA